MTRKKYRIERRKHPRIELRSVTLAFNDSTFGEVIDIGRGGLALHTVGGGSESDPQELSLLTGDGNFFWNNVSCKIVSDVEADREKAGNYVKKIRRQGIQFEELTPEQQSQLQEFINRQKPGS